MNVKDITSLEDKWFKIQFKLRNITKREWHGSIIYAGDLYYSEYGIHDQKVSHIEVHNVNTIKQFGYEVKKKLKKEISKLSFFP